jgi:hypothetical protein
MKFQTVRELLGEVSPSVTEENLRGMTLKPSVGTGHAREACLLADVHEEGSVYRAQCTRGMPRPR